LRLKHLFLRGRQLVADGAWKDVDAVPGRCLWTA